jgi:hypothetical protein
MTDLRVSEVLRFRVSSNVECQHLSCMQTKIVILLMNVGFNTLKPKDHFT